MGEDDSVCVLLANKTECVGSCVYADTVYVSIIVHMWCNVYVGAFAFVFMCTKRHYVVSVCVCERVCVHMCVYLLAVA